MVFKDLTFRNIGDGSSHSHSVLNVVEGFTAAASDNRNPNYKRYFINITMESGKLYRSYAPINLNMADGLYFKDITINDLSDFAYYVSITGLSTHANKNPGSRNIVFAGKLDLPAEKRYVSGNIPALEYLSRIIINIWNSVVSLMPIAVHIMMLLYQEN